MTHLSADKHNTQVVVAGGDRVTGVLFQRILERHGYRVATFTRDEDEVLLRYCQQHPPHLVIVDSRHNPLYGAELCGGIRNVPGCESVFMLAVIPNDPDVLKMMLTIGADDCVIDPVREGRILRRVEILLRSERYHEQAPDADALISNSERKYRYLFDFAGDAVFIVDLKQDRILDVNRRAMKWLGYTRDQLLNRSYSSLEVRDESYPDEKTIGQESSESGYFVFEQLYLASDGRVIPAEVSSCLLMVDGRRTVLNFVRDLTQRKQIEAAEKDQRRLAETLAETAAALNSTLRVDEVIKRVLSRITRIIPGEAANIMLIENGSAFIGAHWGYDQLDVEGGWLGRTWDITVPSNLSWVVKNRRPSVIFDTFSSDKWVELGETTWIRSSVSAPIVVENEVLGIINVDHRQPNRFTLAHGEHLLAFANQAGIAIQNARLHEAAQQHVDLLAARVEQRTSELREMNLSLHRQIEEREQIERELAEERNLLRTLIDNVPDEIYVKDLEGRIILANQALIDRIRHRAPGQQVIGSTSFDYMPYDQAKARADYERSLMEKGQSVFNETWIVAGRDIEPVSMLSTKVPLKGKQDSTIGLVVINRNVTELKNIEERLNLVIRGANCLLWSANVVDNGDRLSWKLEISSDLAAQNFLPLKVGPDETYWDVWRQSILPDDREAMRTRSQKAIRSGAAGYEQEFRVRPEDSQIRWLHETVKITQIDRTNFSLVGVAIDVTERKKAERTLQRANEILEQRVTARTAELVEVNQFLRQQIIERQRAEQSEREQRLLAEALSEVAALLNKSLDLDEVLNQVLVFLEKVVPPHETSNIMLIEDSSTVRAIRIHNAPARPDGLDDANLLEPFPMESLTTLHYISQTGKPLAIPDTHNTNLWTHADGRDWIRSYIGVPIQNDGNVIGFLNLASKMPNQFSEIHARRLLAFSDQVGIAIQNARLFQAVQQHAEQLSHRVAERTTELEYERSQLRAILDAMTEGVIYYDASDRVRYVNQSLIRLTGYSEDDWLASEGTRYLFRMLDDQSEDLLHDHQERVQRQGIWRQRVKMRRKTGDLFDVSLVITRTGTPSDHASGRVVVLRDISAEKRLEEQKTRFIATASHELRTPITNMKTRLYLIRRQPEQLTQHLEVLNSVTDRMRKLVDDLLDVSRFEHGVITLECELIQLQDVVKAVYDVQYPEAQAKNQKMTLQMEPPPLPVYADRSRILQVITNLVTNAINYTDTGGKIAVRVSRQVRDDKRCCAVIEVSDNGIGIPAELQSEVFKPFFRANDYTSGVGLGLSITKEIVELHEGDISLESNEPAGVTFVVRLPLAE